MIEAASGASHLEKVAQEEVLLDQVVATADGGSRRLDDQTKEFSIAEDSLATFRAYQRDFRLPSTL